MKWSLQIARVVGIGIFVHWTFLILIAWIVFAHVAAGNSLAIAVEGVSFVLALFGCVVLHELGHALTAKRFGVRTRDITLLPIGGVARLERIPEKPWQEFWVAIAGPAVNVVIAGVLFTALSFIGRMSQVYQIQDVVGGSFLAKLMLVNIALVVFNLLPAFPMDGGRVLRSLLATRMDRVRATHIAASVGQVMAILFGLAGLMSGNWILLFIALFVYVGAQGEAQAVQMRSIFQNVLVREAMATQVQTVVATNSLQQAMDMLLAGHQQDFPVVDGAQLVGILHRRDLLKALTSEDAGSTVSDIMCRECPFVGPLDQLDKATEMMQEADCSTIPVMDGGQMVGILTSENIGEWAMIQSALRERQSRAAVSA